ncbi:MAG TPA: transporter, partial [Thermoanaerobaculia bacterium]|nr:transporter [Thermoanaerobaculia bacterium]
KVRLTGDAAGLAPGRPAVSLLLGTSVPVGDDELTSDAWEPEAKLALAWELTSWLSLSANAGAAYRNAPGVDDRFTQISASLSAGFAVTDRLGAFAEVYGFSEEELEGDSTRYVDGGVTWLIGNDLQLDARVGWGLNDPDPDWFAGVGAGLRF